MTILCHSLKLQKALLPPDLNIVVDIESPIALRLESAILDLLILLLLSGLPPFTLSHGPRDILPGILSLLIFRVYMRKSGRYKDFGLKAGFDFNLFLWDFRAGEFINAGRPSKMLRNCVYIRLEGMNALKFLVS